jgi:hypothetical protein
MNDAGRSQPQPPGVRRARRGGTYARRTSPESGDFREPAKQEVRRKSPAEVPDLSELVLDEDDRAGRCARKGALGLSLYPTTNAGGETPELSITFMPA